MAILPDLAPTETVMVRGKPVPVVGVPVKDIAALLIRFPEFGALFGMANKTLDTARLLGMGDAVVAAIIAAGLGRLGDQEEEAIASGLVLEEQFDLIEAVMRLTMPKGAGPFVTRVMAFMGTLELPPNATGSKPAAGPPPLVFPPGADVTRVKRSTQQLNG